MLKLFAVADTAGTAGRTAGQTEVAAETTAAVAETADIVVAAALDL